MERVFIRSRGWRLGSFLIVGCIMLGACGGYAYLFGSSANDANAADLIAGDSSPQNGLQDGFERIGSSLENSNKICFQCGENLRALASASLRYATNHNSHLPTHLIDMKEELRDPNFLICPESTNRFKSDWSDFDEQKASYRIYKPVPPLGISARYIYCNIHKEQQMLGDGRVMARTAP
jgi:hypothetical protein